MRRTTIFPRAGYTLPIHIQFQLKQQPDRSLGSKLRPKGYGICCNGAKNLRLI